MQDDDLLSTLLDLAQEQGIQLRVMPAMNDDPQRGGSLVRLKGKDVLFLNEAASTGEQIDAVAAALKGRAGLEARYLAPEVRQRIEQQ